MVVVVVAVVVFVVLVVAVVISPWLVLVALGAQCCLWPWLTTVHDPLPFATPRIPALCPRCVQCFKEALRWQGRRMDLGLRAGNRFAQGEAHRAKARALLDEVGLQAPPPFSLFFLPSLPCTPRTALPAT